MLTRRHFPLSSVTAWSRSPAKGEASIAQVAKDFGVYESCLQRWLKTADVEDGTCPGFTASEAAETRELCERVQFLDQENEVLRRAAA